ncbi:MAG: polysaccharide biosynthesis/export family protein [Pirellulales bacterium]|nr:polysaccharide biosynthesis/export family protein [Pirellulales bacterium]
MNESLSCMHDRQSKHVRRLAAVSYLTAACLILALEVLLTATPTMAQALGPAAPQNVCGLDCFGDSGCQSYGECCKRCGGYCEHGCGRGWEDARQIAWQAYAQGEYVGPARIPHVHEYRLRPDDQLDFVYRLTREEQPTPYKLNVGDEVRVESSTDPNIDRDTLLIQPDGTITLRLLGQVHATGLTVAQLHDEIERLYKKYYKVPAITVTPIRVNSKLDDLRNAVDNRYGAGGQNRFARVTPAGTISLPAVGQMFVQGLTLKELRVELRERYRQEVEGIEVIPVLIQRAPRYIYVIGEVREGGRFELTGPTTAIQAISMARGWNNGAWLRQVVIFRRGDDWRQLATMVNLRAALYAKEPCPVGNLWLSDSDTIIVPKNPILVADDFIDLVFTRGIYGVFPMTSVYNLNGLESL